MTDETERAVQKIARRANGVSKSVDDIFDLVLAVNKDSDNQAKVIVARLDTLNTSFLAHCQAADLRDLRIDALEGHQGSTTGVEDSDEREHARKVWVMWGLGSKVGNLLLTLFAAGVVAAINLAINYMWFGAPVP